VDGLKYKRKFTINTSADGELFQYQIKLTINKGVGSNNANTIYLNDNALNWPYDVRFENANGIELVYWIENYDSSTATVWLNLAYNAASGSDDFYIYYGKVNCQNASSGKRTFDYFLPTGDDEDFTYLSNFSIAASADWAQGIAVDEDYVYFSKNETLRKYSKAGVLQASNLSAHTDGTDMLQINGICVKDSYLYVSSCNWADIPAQSYIKVYNKSDLAYVTEYQINNRYSEDIDWKYGTWWVISHAWNYIAQYDENFNFIKDRM